MKVLGIIPARFASSRFPGKPLANIHGKTMIQRVYEQAKQATLLNDVVVATDDDTIAESIRRFGGQVILTDTAHPNGTSRCAEAAGHFPGYDLIVNIQGDEPYIHPEQIDALCGLFSDTETGLFTQARRLDDPAAFYNPNIVKVRFDGNGYATTFEREPAVSEGTNYKHIGLYGYRADTLQQIIRLAPTANEQRLHLEQLRWLDHGFRIKVGLTEYESLSVDVPEDVGKFGNVTM